MKSALLAAALALAACSSMSNNEANTVSARWFGYQKDDRPARLWTLHVPGLEIDVTDYGATLVAVRTPDRAGVVDDVVLGFDDVSGYQSGENQYFGCTAGRVCNRIKKGEFTLDGYTFVLAANNGPNHLHGGTVRSFDKVHWEGKAGGSATSPSLRLTYRSRDGEEGYPGNLEVAVTYTLLATTPPQMRIVFEASTDRRTPVNITNHAYWNLEGAGAPTVLEHQLWVDANSYTPTDDTLIPTGKIAPVLATPLDFTKALPLGLRIGELENTPALGYDHNLVLRPASGLRKVAELRAPNSGRWLAIATTEPALQVYSGNHLHGQVGKRGRVYGKRSACCLETQHYPDSINEPQFPTTILEPGQRYRSETQWTFGVD
jgi:aldose 1-epimerase